jgi:hypothetical protein
MREVLEPDAGAKCVTRQKTIRTWLSCPGNTAGWFLRYQPEKNTWLDRSYSRFVSLDYCGWKYCSLVYYERKTLLNDCWFRRTSETNRVTRMETLFFLIIMALLASVFPRPRMGPRWPDVAWLRLYVSRTAERRPCHEPAATARVPSSFPAYPICNT